MNDFPTMEYIANDYLSKNKNNEKNYFGAISLPSEKQETLRHYQDAAIREVFYRISKGKKKCLLSLATGTGKTKIAVHIAKKLSEANLLKRVLFLCDRDELRTQALSEFKKFFGNDVASIKTNKPELNARILITTYQMMLSGDDSSEEDLNFYKKHFHKDFFSHIIIDECHRSAWNKWYKILEYNPNAIKIGLTATPREIEFDEESDETNIDKEILRDNIKYFGEPIFEYSLGQAVEDGYLPACEIIAKDIVLADHIDKGVEALQADQNLDSAVTVSQYNWYSPVRARKIGPDGTLQPFIPFENHPSDLKIDCDRNTQGDIYFADVCVSIVRPHCLEDLNNGVLPQKWMGRKIYPIFNWGGLDIDKEWQMPQLKYWLKYYGFTKNKLPYDH